MSRRRGTGSIFKQPGCKTWTIKYYRAGKCYREATGLTDYQAARQKLNQKLGKIAEGAFVEPNLERIRIEELMLPFFRYQTVNGCKDVERGQQRWKTHLEPFFAGRLVAQLTTDVLNQYVDHRLAQDASPATINREIAVLRGAFRLGAFSTPPKVHRLPRFPHLDEDNVRKGFVVDEQYARMTAHASELWLRGMLEMAYEYGWRRSELIGLRVRNVDLKGDRVRLDTSKNGEPRLVVMTANVRALLTQCIINKLPEDFVFTRDGRPIGDFRKRWRKLCTAAGLPALLFHDLRRSGVRNMLRSGITEDVAMKISGHKTREIFSRYNITAERDLEEAARKSEARRRLGHDFGHDSQQSVPVTMGSVN